MTTKKVLIGLSGGVDSSVSAYILKQKYDVTGIFCVMSDVHFGMVPDAQKCADFLEIPLIVADLRKEFAENVIAPFMQGYVEGKTPNPCTICNPSVKFEILNKKN